VSEEDGGQLRRPGVPKYDFGLFDSPTHFDGKTYDPKHDLERLTTQLGRVYDAMERGLWFTLAEISTLTGDPEASVSARVRDLRKKKFGGYTIERRRRGDPKLGIWEYKLWV